MINKIAFLMLIVSIILLSGCESLTSKQDSKIATDIADSDNVDLDDMTKKYQYDCANGGDHSKHDYVLQDDLISRCQAKCCGSKYCEKCQWDGYGDCYSECEANAPEGVCVNCDGVCWENGHLDFLNTAIATC